MLKRLFGRGEAKVHGGIVVVSGLPRSGTSMMMKMLEAGGLRIVSDGLRRADEDNPNGYYEVEAVKGLAQGGTDWLEGAAGGAVKVISALLEHLPGGYHYKVIFMERRLAEVLASQKKMLSNRQEEARLSDEEMEAEFSRHLAAVKYWLARQPNIEVLYVDHRALLEAPEEACRRVAAFLGLPLDVEKMAAVPDRSLYRNRAG
jgi:hypothetical protein